MRKYRVRRDKFEHMLRQQQVAIRTGTASAMPGADPASNEFSRLRARVATLCLIDEALARLRTGTYGACLDCGREIDEAYLRDTPFAISCQSCTGPTYASRRPSAWGSAWSRLALRRRQVLQDPQE